jgi:lysophospholipase L1-like esterase
MPQPVLLDAIRAFPLLPLLALQARHVRRVTPRLPEPDGPREGRRGAGTPLRLLILGDSAAAGVGVSHQDEALAGCLVRELADLPALEWRLLARTGDTTADTLHALRDFPDVRCDVVVTSLGVNDVTRLRSANAFVSLQQQLIEHLRTRCGARRILISGLPPMHAFPALPPPLRGFIGRHARRLDDALAAWLATQADCEHLPFGELPAADMMATDGFHPGPPIYADWAQRLAGRIRASELNAERTGTTPPEAIRELRSARNDHRARDALSRQRPVI